jgi:hypothetical protein
VAPGRCFLRKAVKVARRWLMAYGCGQNDRRRLEQEQRTAILHPSWETNASETTIESRAMFCSLCDHGSAVILRRLSRPKRAVRWCQTCLVLGKPSAGLTLHIIEVWFFAEFYCTLLYGDMSPNVRVFHLRGLRSLLVAANISLRVSDPSSPRHKPDLHKLILACTEGDASYFGTGAGAG